MGGEDLGDGTAAVIADQIDLFNPKRVNDLGDHVRLGDERDVLRWRDFAIAESHHVYGDAAPPVLDAVNDMTPVIAVEGHSMDKECGRPLTFLEEGNTAGFDAGEAAARMKGRNIHSRLPPCLEVNLGPISSAALS